MHELNWTAQHWPTTQLQTEWHWTDTRRQVICNWTGYWTELNWTWTEHRIELNWTEQNWTEDHNLWYKRDFEISVLQTSRDDCIQFAAVSCVKEWKKYSHYFWEYWPSFHCREPESVNWEQQQKLNTQKLIKQVTCCSWKINVWAPFSEWIVFASHWHCWPCIFNHVWRNSFGAQTSSPSTKAKSRQQCSKLSHRVYNVCPLIWSYTWIVFQ